MSNYQKFVHVLACPSCGAGLEKNSIGVVCTSCGITYADGSNLDLRLQKEKAVQVGFTIAGAPTTEIGFETLKANPAPQVYFSGAQIPYHITPELISYFPKASKLGVLALDLGCGNTLHRPICEAAGFDYVGLDYAAPEAPILGDAHALPFKNDSFEFILSIAVLEHIQYPFVMVNEVFRVLKPGGKFIGTVAFLEPFHGDSYYHHSHLGTYNMLRFAGFKVDVVAPSAEWSVLEAQASMGLFPRMPRFLSHALVKPIKFASRCWWWLAGVLGREANLQKLTLNTTGAFSFVATKVQ